MFAFIYAYAHTRTEIHPTTRYMLTRLSRHSFAQARYFSLHLLFYTRIPPANGATAVFLHKHNTTRTQAYTFIHITYIYAHLCHDRNVCVYACVHAKNILKGYAQGFDGMRWCAAAAAAAAYTTVAKLVGGRGRKKRRRRARAFVRSAPKGKR